MSAPGYFNPADNAGTQVNNGGEWGVLSPAQPNTVVPDQTFATPFVYEQSAITKSVMVFGNNLRETIPTALVNKNS